MSASRSCSSCPPRLRLVHAGLLVVWLLSCQAFGPLLIMAVGGITGDHTLKVCASRSGEMSVVLGHAETGGAGLAEEWGAAEPALEAAVVAQMTKPDHCVRLRSVEQAAAQTRRVVAKGPVEVVLPVPGVPVRDFRAGGGLTPARVLLPQAQWRWTAGLQVKAGRTVLRC